MSGTSENTRAEKEMIHYLFELHKQGKQTNELLQQLIIEVRKLDERRN